MSAVLARQARWRASIAWWSLHDVARHAVVAPLLGVVLVLDLQRIAPEAWATSWLLAAATPSIGAWLIRRTARALDDPRFELVTDAFFVKLLAVLVILHLGWLPDLDIASPLFGYDPQRYYFDAWDLLRANFDRSAVPAINYAGILYYYALVFGTFGHDPLAPALLNTLLTLGATLVIAHVAYAVRPARRPWHWTIGLAILIPDIVWYDVTTSRESLGIFLVTGTTLLAGRALWGVTTGVRAARDVAFAILGLVGVGMLRLVMVVPVGAAVFGLLARARLSLRQVAASVLLVAATGTLVVTLPGIATRLGSADTNLQSLVGRVTGQRDEQWINNYEWSERSMGRFLLADDPLQALVLAPVRLTVFLAAPLPNFFFDAEGLLAGYWDAWQKLLTGLSAWLFLFGMPYALAPLPGLWRSRGRSPDALLQVPFWAVVLGIVIGSQMLIERFRVMSLVLLWGVMWLGFDADARTLRGARLVWAGLLAMTVVLYIGLKFGVIG